MPGSSKLLVPVRAVHACIDRVEESSRAHPESLELNDALRRVGETADALAAVTSAPSESRQETAVVESLLKRLSGACSQLERMLVDLEAGDPVSLAVLALLSSCSALAIFIMETPAIKPLVSVA